MIVKSISKKGVCFGKLLAYIGTSERAEDGIHEQGMIFHNLKHPIADPVALEREFLDNHRFVRARRNGVTCFHEILSFKKSHPDINKILEDLGRTYLDLRAPHALAYGRVHLHNGHPHLHLLISGNEIESSQKIRVSKHQFSRIKQDLEHYQKRRYPFLSHSVVFGPDKTKKQLTRAQTLIRGQVLRFLDVSETEESFSQRLKQAGMQLYQRGKSMGVKVFKTGKKYRFQKLDLQAALQTRRTQWEKGQKVGLSPNILQKSKNQELRLRCEKKNR